MSFNETESSPEDRISEQAIAWFSRLHADTVSETDKERFQHWKQQNPAHERAYLEIVRLMEDADFNRALKETPLTSVQRQRMPSIFNLGFVRSSALIGGIAFCFAFFDPVIRLQSDYRTGVGEQQEVQLPDGSVAVLNTDSALAFHSNGKQRQIRLLKGEVFFSVKPDDTKPFIVTSDHTETRVVGTQFFVKRHAESDKITVIEGLVSVNHLADRQTVNLHPQQQVISSKNGLTKVATIDATDEAAWLHHRIIYTNTPLEDVFNDLERYLPGRIFIADSALKSYKINARLDIADPANALNALHHTLPITITHFSPWVTVIDKQD